MSAQSKNSALSMSRATSNVTSLRESVDGHERLHLQDGQPTKKSGRDLVLVSRSRPQDKDKDSMMSGISGRRGSNSLKSADLQSFLESRLRRRNFGSTQYVLTWQEKTTASG